jgi:hypothetical protein
MRGLVLIIEKEVVEFMKCLYGIYVVKPHNGYCP